MNSELRRVTIPPHGHGWFNDHPIEVTAPNPGALEGFLEMSFKYGRPGNLKYELIVKKQVVVAFNEEGLYTGGAWNDAV